MKSPSESLHRLTTNLYEKLQLHGPDTPAFTLHLCKGYGLTITRQQLRLTVYLLLGQLIGLGYALRYHLYTVIHTEFQSKQDDIARVPMLYQLLAYWFLTLRYSRNLIPNLEVSASETVDGEIDRIHNPESKRESYVPVITLDESEEACIKLARNLQDERTTTDRSRKFGLAGQFAGLTLVILVIVAEFISTYIAAARTAYVTTKIDEDLVVEMSLISIYLASVYLFKMEFRCFPHKLSLLTNFLGFFVTLCGLVVVNEFNLFQMKASNVVTFLLLSLIHTLFYTVSHCATSCLLRDFSVTNYLAKVGVIGLLCSAPVTAFFDIVVNKSISYYDFKNYQTCLHIGSLALVEAVLRTLEAITIKYAGLIYFRIYLTLYTSYRFWILAVNNNSVATSHHWIVVGYLIRLISCITFNFSPVKIVYNVKLGIKTWSDQPLFKILDSYLVAYKSIISCNYVTIKEKDEEDIIHKQKQTFSQRLSTVYKRL